jgi:hypothetical protein
MLFNKLLYIGNWKALSPYVSWLKKQFILIQLGKLKEVPTTRLCRESFDISDLL